jgi:3',5'-cyclic-AMP phosphodiesterase
VPTVVAMHHAPIVTGISAMDGLGLPGGERAALGALLARSPQVRRVVAGHIHRAAFGLLGGCPVFACPSTHLQVRLDPRGTDIVLEPAPQAFALHALLDGGDVVTHVQPVTAT